MSKKTIGFILAILVIVILVVIKLSSKEDDWICKDGKWIMHGNPSSLMPSSGCESNEVIVQEQPIVTKEIKPFIVTSAFLSGEAIPDIYTCKGNNTQPPFHFDGMPEGAKSLALLVDDPDAPRGTWTHWLVWNIGLLSDMGENFLPLGAVQGKNSWGTLPYRGPCPPSGTHRYFFNVYALDTLLELSSGSTKKQFEEAIKGHIVGSYSLVGTFEK